MITVIYGPPATGKTSNAERFRRHFGCRQTHDFGLIGALDRLEPTAIARADLRSNDLILTTAHPEEIRKALPGKRFRAIPITDALAAIGGAA